MFPCLISEGAVGQVEAVAMLERKQSTDEELLPLGIFLEVVIFWWWEGYLRFRDTGLAVAHDPGKVLSSHASSLGVTATSPEYFVNVDGEGS